MLRINDGSRPLILNPLFSALDKLDFGDGKVASFIVSGPFRSNSLCSMVRESLHVTTSTRFYSSQLLKEANSLTRCAHSRQVPPSPPVCASTRREGIPCCCVRKSRVAYATASLCGRRLACAHLSDSPPCLVQSTLGLHGSDLGARTASHASITSLSYQCVCGLLHPGRTPHRTGAGHFQTREVLVGP